jgi:hypothetical protein
MKKMDDEEIQKWLEENGPASGKTNKELISDDARAYQFLFDVLDEEPLQGLPYDFAAKVTRKVQAEAKRTSELRYFIIAIAVVALVLVAIYGLLMLVKPGAGPSYGSLLLQYKWVLILVVFSFLTIQYLDQILVKGKIFESAAKIK